jgi:hypothetical protein
MWAGKEKHRSSYCLEGLLMKAKDACPSSSFPLLLTHLRVTTPAHQHRHKMMPRSS